MAVASVKKSASKHFAVEGINKNVKGIVEKSVQPTAKPVMQQKQLYSTVDGGRVHVGLEENYAGSIDSYNNFLTRCVAKLFGWSTQVTIDGKCRHVNKSDYIRWLNNNTAHKDVTAENVAGFLDVALLEIKAESTQGAMRDHVSAERARLLFEKMVKALVVNNDFVAAKKYAGKGANLDDSFWIREGYPLSLTGLKADLPEDKALEFRAGRYTPLLYAAEKGNKAFCDFLVKLKANTFAHGEYLQFTRIRSELNPITDIQSAEDVLLDNDLRTRIKLKTTTTIQFEDQVTPKTESIYNIETGKLTRIESKAPVVIERFSKPQERISYKYIQKS